ncbi:MAG: accessory factor UbiK family protein [Alphaproteobacteria bacterium]|nr:accessory factor UbiK family protein [Alphaproteobacteria bacterium]
MLENKDKILDDIARVAGGAAGVFSGLGSSIREDIKSRVDEMAERLDLVPREDFERLKALVEAQNKRIEALEEALAAKAKKTSK